MTYKSAQAVSTQPGGFPQREYINPRPWRPCTTDPALLAAPLPWLLNAGVIVPVSGCIQMGIGLFSSMSPPTHTLYFMFMRSMWSCHCKFSGDNTNCRRGCGATEWPLLVGVQGAQTCWETEWQHLLRLSRHPPTSQRFTPGYTQAETHVHAPKTTFMGAVDQHCLS